MSASSLVTGGSGFIGRAVLRSLGEQGHEVAVLGRRPVPGHRTVLADIGAVIDLGAESFRYVFHLAGLAHLEPRTRGERERFTTVNLVGTRNLLSSLERCRELPATFLFVSTVAVYGLEEGELVEESAERRATDPYGLSKRQAEDLVLDWVERRGVRTAIVRLPLVAGPQAPGHLQRMIRAVAAGRYLGVGGGTARRSMVRVADVAQMMARAADVGGIFHLTDGYHPSFAELEAALAAALDRRAPWHLPMPVAHAAAWVGDVLEAVTRRRMPFNRRTLAKMSSTLTFSDEKARRTLGWKPTRVLDFAGELVEGTNVEPESGPLPVPGSEGP